MNYDPRIIEDYIKSIDYYNFQDFCDRFLITQYPDDYTPVRAGGRNGDMRNDGYCSFSRIFFQAHATRGESARKTKEKIENDFIGCINHWKNVIKFVYITNDILIGEVELFVDELRSKHPNIKIETWSQQIIISKIRELNIEDIEYIINRKIIPEYSHSNSELTSAKYLVTSNFNFIKEISNRDFENFPFENPLLFENDVFKFLHRLLKNQNYRNNEIENSINIDEKQYSSIHPDVTTITNKEEEHQFFYHERIPNSEEIENVAKTDNISIFLLKNKIETKKICKIQTCYAGECAGDGKFQELFLLRPLYAKFLVLKNISNVPIKLNTIDILSNNGILYGDSELNSNNTINLPNFIIEPSQNIVIPTGLLRSDFNEIDKLENVEVSSSSLPDQLQILHLGDLSKNQEIEFIGPSITPQKIYAIASSRPFDTEVHKFSFDSVYWVNRHWQCGSCPHLFFANNNKLNYQGEIFNVLPDQMQTEEIIVPKGITKIIIAELEQETTYIEKIIKNETLVAEKVFLSENEFYSFSVSKNDVITLNGKYTLDSTQIRRLPITAKKDLVEKFKLKTMPIGSKTSWRKVVK